MSYFLLTLLTLLLSPAAAETSPPQPDLLYHNHCSVCHGDKGDGQSHARSSLQPPPRDFTDPAYAASLSRERMLQAVTRGVPGTAMVGWSEQLSATEIAAVVDYIREDIMPQATTVPISRGEKIYAHSCSVCHGEQGNGAKWGSNLLARPPRDFTSEASRHELTRERMIHAVTHGLPNTPMMGFSNQLSAADIEAVVDYVRERFLRPPIPTGLSGTSAHGKTDMTAIPPNPGFPKMGVITQPLIPESEKGATPEPVDMQAVLPDGLRGDPIEGKALYLQNCVPCHGIAGDGEGPRAYFIFPRPRDFTRDYSRAVFNRPRLYRSIGEGKNGTEMPAWSRVLSPQQIADLSEYVFQAFIQGQETPATARR